MNDPKKPTIEELEAILNSPVRPMVRIAEDGSLIAVDPNEKEKAWYLLGQQEMRERAARVAEAAGKLHGDNIPDARQVLKAQQIAAIIRSLEIAKDSVPTKTSTGDDSPQRSDVPRSQRSEP